MVKEIQDSQLLCQVLKCAVTNTHFEIKLEVNFDLFTDVKIELLSLYFSLFRMLYSFIWIVKYWLGAAGLGAVLSLCITVPGP